MKIEFLSQFNTSRVGALWLIGLFFAVLASTSPANAQVAGVDPFYQPPAATLSDQNNVDLLGGIVAKVSEPALTIGPAGSGQLTYQRSHSALNGQTYQVLYNSPPFAYFAGTTHTLYGAVRSYPGYVFHYPNEEQSILYDVQIGPYADKFRHHPPPADTFSSLNKSGATLERSAVYQGPYGPTTDLIYTAPDGARATFKWNATGQLVDNLVLPDGVVLQWHYNTAIYDDPSTPVVENTRYFRLQSVTNNLGYQIHFKYQRDSFSSNAQFEEWAKLVKVTGIDNAVYACAPLSFTCSDSTGAEWPYLQYGSEGTLVDTVTDRVGGVTRYVYETIPQTVPLARKLVAVRSALAGPASTGKPNTISYLGNDTNLTVSGSNGSWNYSLNDAGADFWREFTTTITGPNGYSRTAHVRGGYETYGEGQEFATFYETPHALTDTINGRTTSYEYDGHDWIIGQRSLIAKVTRPEGGYTEFAYDSRRNVTHIRHVANPGSGNPDVHVYASYPEPGATACANAKTCNQPSWVTIPGAASGNPSSLPKTDYTYDAGHGGVLTVTKPAPGWGPYASIRPQVRNTYSDNGTGIVRLWKTSACATTSSCAGTADETVVETTYNAKRLPSTVVTKEGDGSPSSTVTTTYTPQGDVASINGPLSGSGDTTRMYYDAMRQLRAAVEPDPDGAGSVYLHRVTKTSYDGDGNPVTVELGTVSTPSSWNSLAVLAKGTTEYDSFGRKVRDNLINVGTGQPETVTQYSYNSAGRVECVARRMNATVYGSLPGACSQSSAGSFGPDRIVRTTYTANGDPSVIQSGYGTSIVRNERTFTYLAPGQVGTVKDAANNLTTYEYDGFNRLSKTRYPKPSNGSVSAATSCNPANQDYCEIVGYDAAGNITSERRRDAQTVSNSYDYLSRIRLKNFPSEPDVTNTNDNMDRLRTASSSNGTITWDYDALGRVKSETQPNGTVSYLYDAASRRTRLTYPGSGFYINYEYYTNGRLKLMGLNGATTGSNVLATFFDDLQGRRGFVCRSAGVIGTCDGGASTGYAYDAASRLSVVTHNILTGGGANNLWVNMSYNPAGQMTYRESYNATYEWPYSQTFNDAYTVNGLNQYTAVAGQGLAHDHRGNTTNDTTKTYTYDVMNRLTSSSNGASLTYDATGRLLSVSQGGATTKFLYDGTRLIGEYNGSGGLLRRYVHGDGIDDPMVWFESSSTADRRNLYKDERGSVIAVEHSSGVTANRYDEYGNFATTDAATAGRFRYTGQTWLPELELYYYKARVYNPDLGRFMQTDPIGYKDQMNLYAYVGNDPLNKTDPSGMCETILTCIAELINPRRETGSDVYDRGGTYQETRAAAFQDGAIEATEKVLIGGTIAFSFVGGPSTGGSAVATNVVTRGAGPSAAAARKITTEILENGTKLITSRGNVKGKAFVSHVETAAKQGMVHVLSGVHGRPDGGVIPAAGFLMEDLAHYGQMANVVVHDYAVMSVEAAKELMRRGETVVGAFCNSGVCLSNIR